MLRRSSAKGNPGQGDPAADEGISENPETLDQMKEEEKPASVVDVLSPNEKEIFKVKETTLRLEAEVMMLRSFAQETVQLLKELRADRNEDKPGPATSSNSFYGKGSEREHEACTLPAPGASAAFFGSYRALPQAQEPSSFPTAFDRTAEKGTVGYIVGNLVHFKGTLDDVNNLHTVIAHVKAFNTHLRVHGESSQLFGKTLTAKALRDLRLHDQNVAELTLLQWQDILAFNFRQGRVDLQDILACLRKVQMEDVVTNSRISRDYYVKNYRAILGYLYTLEEFRSQTEMYTGVPCNYPKPEASRVRNGREGGPTCLNDIVNERMEYHLRQFIPLLHKGVEFRTMTSWKQILNCYLENINSALNTYLDNRFVFQVFENIDREHGRAWQQRAAPRDNANPVYKDKRDEKQRPPGAERERKLFPVPRHMPSTSYPQRTASAGLAAIGLGNNLSLESDLDWNDEEEFSDSSNIPSSDYETPREGNSADSADSEDEQDANAQAMITSLAAMHDARRPMVDGKRTEKAPGTSACWHHLMGTCTKGTECSFSHTKAEGMALIRLLEKNIERKPEITRLASMVWEEGESARMRLRATIEGHEAIAMVDPGSEKFDFVSRDFIKRHGIPTYEAQAPIQVDLAGTGNKYVLRQQATLLFKAMSPITGTLVQYTSAAYVLPMSRDDLIIGMDNIVEYMIPLTIELLLVAQKEHRQRSTSAFTAYIPGITSDVYALAAMYRDPEVLTPDDSALTDAEDIPPLINLREHNAEAERDNRGDMPGLRPLRAFREPVLVPLEPWNSASRMVPAPVHRRIYDPLQGEEEAPEDAVHSHVGIFGANDILTNAGYSSREAFESRRQEALQLLQHRVALNVEDPMHAAHISMLTDNIPAFTCQHWTGIKVDPIHIEFLPSLPDTIRCASRTYAPEILPRMKEKMETFVEQGYMERIIKSPWASPTVPVLKKDPDGGMSKSDIR